MCIRDRTSSSPEEASPSSVPTENSPQYSLGKNTTPEPAWGNSKLSAYSWLICDW